MKIDNVQPVSCDGCRFIAVQVDLDPCASCKDRSHYDGAPVHPRTERKHSHYFKDCPFGQVDVYRVLHLFNVTDPCLQHAVKKLLVAGGRGAGKDCKQDIQEAIDTLQRWTEMRAEEERASGLFTATPGGPG